MAHFFYSLILCLLLPRAEAANLGGVDIPDTLPATQAHPKLILNGTSIREFYGVIDTYIGQLYLEHPSKDPDRVITDSQYFNHDFFGLNHLSWYFRSSELVFSISHRKCIHHRFSRWLFLT